jgi:hypothetical protein
MPQLALDAQYADLAYSGGQLQTIDGIDAVTQGCAVAYDTGLGEYSYDTDAGVAFLQIIRRPGATDSEIVAELRRVGARLPDVEQVTEVVLTRDPTTRKLTADITILTVFGTQQIRVLQ